MRSGLEWRGEVVGQEDVLYLLLLTGAEMGMAGGRRRRGGGRVRPGPVSGHGAAALVRGCCWKWPYTSNIMGWVLMYSMKDLVTVTVMF